MMQLNLPYQQPCSSPAFTLALPRIWFPKIIYSPLHMYTNLLSCPTHIFYFQDYNPSYPLPFILAIDSLQIPESYPVFAGAWWMVHLLRWHHEWILITYFSTPRSTGDLLGVFSKNWDLPASRLYGHLLYFALRCLYKSNHVKPA